MRSIGTKVGVAASLIALGGLGGVALSNQSQSATPAAKRVAQPVEVRTQVIRKTVHVIRRERPKKAPPARPAVVAAPPAPVAVQAPRVVPVSAPAAPRYTPARSSKPLSTRTSGAAAGGRRGGERDDEGGERDD